MNPYVRGAYSYRTGPFNPKMNDPLGPTVNQETVNKKDFYNHKMISNKINCRYCFKVPNLLFAGEAYHPTHFSSAHGAFE